MEKLNLDNVQCVVHARYMFQKLLKKISKNVNFAEKCDQFVGTLICIFNNFQVLTKKLKYFS